MKNEYDVQVQAPPSPEQLQQAERTLSEILQATSAVDEQLPYLTAEVSTFEKWLTEMKEWLEDWIQSMLPKESNPELTKTILNSLYYTAIVVAAVLVGMLLYFLVKALLKKERDSVAPSSPTSDLLIPKSSLPKLIEEALAKGNFSLAARLRWQLFLHHLKQKTVLTPFEMAPLVQVQGWTETALLQYRTMFAKEQASKEDFESCSRKLSEIERHQRGETL